MDGQRPVKVPERLIRVIEHSAVWAKNGLIRKLGLKSPNRFESAFLADFLKHGFKLTNVALVMKLKLGHTFRAVAVEPRNFGRPKERRRVERFSRLVRRPAPNGYVGVQIHHFAKFSRDPEMKMLQSRPASP